MIPKMIASTGGITAAAVLFAYTTYRLRCACKYYLRMDHSLAMAVSVQLIPFLIVTILAMWAIG